MMTVGVKKFSSGIYELRTVDAGKPPTRWSVGLALVGLSRERDGFGWRRTSPFGEHWGRLVSSDGRLSFR